MLGHRSAMPENFSSLTTIKACAGPLGHSVEDLKVAMEVLFHPELNTYDPYVPPCPFRDALFSSSS